MARTMRPETDWILLAGKTLAQIEMIAIRACFIRCNGSQRKMMGELRISRSNLLRKLDRLGLRQRKPGWTLRENDLARAFFLHCQSIATELNVSPSTLLRWVNKRAPFSEVE